MKNNGICETCKHNKENWINVTNDDRFCDSCNSDHFAKNTEYLRIEECKAWERKE